MRHLLRSLRSSLGLALTLASPVVATLGAQAGASASGPAPTAALPSANSILAKADAAMGGRAAMEKHQSVHQTGTISIAVANLSGALEIWRARPNLLVQRQELGMLGTITTGYDGTNAWSNSSQAGPQMLDGDAANELKNTADFFADFYDPAKIKSATTLGIVDFEGKKAYELKLVRLNDTESRNYFDVETGLRIGQSSRVTAMGQTVDQTAVLSEYKEFGGLKFPTKIVRKLGMADVVLEVTKVEFDNVDAKAFELPEAVKIIVKKP